ncbi:MAG: hypothetical protein HOM21_06615, partial [Halobacteriovoraceae bacterium]|nr:hypothetical protein [Halobacteriovoraceae bacterium]
FSHIIDEKLSIEAINSIVNGHPSVFQAFKKFLGSPNKKITYVIGNHDAHMGFSGAQDFLKGKIGQDLRFCHELQLEGVHIEHGHRFEVINTVPAHKRFLDGPHGKKILNLPWGSLFCISVLPQLKKERPLIDKVRPMSSYIKWTFLHDFPFFIRMGLTILKYFFRTSFDTYTRHNRNFKTTIGVLKQISIYPNYDRKARAIFKKNPGIHTVIMGHTHVQEWRRFPSGKYYFNTGTWNPIPSMDAGMHESTTALTYCTIDIHSKTKTVRGASLNTWQGKWRPFREEMVTH